MRNWATFLGITGLCVAAAACGRKDETTSSATVSKESSSSSATTAKDLTSSLVGQWRAVLESPGGELPFALDLRTIVDGTATISNGEEKIRVDARVSAGRVVLSFPVYDAEVNASLDERGELRGTWSKTTPEGQSSLPFRATRATPPPGPRFTPLASDTSLAGDDSLSTIAGSWHVTFTDTDGETPAVGEFEQAGTDTTGTFLTSTGDLRFLQGTFERGLLRLSTFDGAHAFLFTAKAQGGKLIGDFWSRDSYHATFSATRAANPAAILPDPFDEVRVVSADGKFRFSFSDASGKVFSSADKRFEGKVLIIDIFGTWCPNCNDSAPLLARLASENKSAGLEVVGLAFEYTGDRDRDRTMLRRFAERHSIAYPLLLAGVSDKQSASRVLTDISPIKSYPTAIFVGRDGRVAKIHSGFAGPGTGAHHQALVHEFETTIKTLLAAAPSQPHAPVKKSAASR